MALPLHIIAIAIEGVGSLRSKASGLALYYGHLTAAQEAALPSGYEWWPALAEVPSPVSASVNPFTGDWSVSAQDYSLEASDRVAALLMSDRRDAAYALDGAITASATSMDVDTSGVSTGDVLWLGDEAVLVGAASGTALTSLTRGFWGTTAQPHADGVGVYTGIPYWRSRKVELLEVDVRSGTVTTRWRGLVSDIAQDAARIEMRCEELLGALAAATVNTDAPKVAPGQARWSGRRLEALSPFRSTSTLSASALDIASSRTLLYQVDEALVPISWSRLGSTGVSGQGRPAEDTSGLAGDTLLLLGSSAPDESEDATPVEEVREVLGWIRQSGTGTGAQGYTPISGSALLPFHPISVCLTLLTSTGHGGNGDYDILAPGWSLGVDYLDWSAWETARDDHPNLVIDRLILGWGGEEVSPFEVVREVLRPFGYYLAITDDGLLYPARLRMVTEGDVDAATNTIGLYPDGPLTLDRSLSMSTASVRAVVGGLPWEDGATITVRDPARSGRAGQLLDARVHTLDLGIFDPSRITTDGVIDAVVSPFVGLLGLGLDTAPVLRGRVADHQQTAGLANLDLGSYVRVDDLGGVVDPWLVLPDGSRVALDATSPRWVGILTERAWDPRDHSYTVALLLINWRAGVAVKLRAPAGVVSIVPGGSIITFTSDGPYGANAGLGFVVGDQVRVCDANGVPTGTGTRTITAVVTNQINTGTAFGVAPSVGEVIRLVQSGSYDNDGIYSATARPYVYLAPDAPTGIEDGSGETEGPDIYGTELFGGTGATPGDLTFVPIDAAAIASAGATTAEPLDAWLEYTLRDNVAEIMTRGHQVTWAPLTASAGDYTTGAGHRPYCSVDQTSLLYVPWICEAGLGAVTLGMIQRVSSESDGEVDVSGASVTLSLELGGAGVDTTLDSTDGDTPEFQPATLALDFSATPLPASQIQQLGVWVQSSVGSVGDDAVSGNATYGDTMISTTSGTIYTDTTGARPNANALDLMCTEDTDKSLYDHLQSRSATKMAIKGGGRGTGNLATTRWLSYVQLRSMDVQQTFVDTAYPTDESMRPGIPVHAETCVGHLVREQRHHYRARPLWVGPQGTRPYDPESSGEGWPEDYTERHIIHNADESTTTSAIFAASIWLDTTDPTVTILLNVIPTRIPDAGSLTQGIVGQPGSETITTAAWETWATVDQLEDGDADWTGATSLGTTVADKESAVLEHWACLATTRYPSLYSHLLRRDEGWTYREGQMWREDVDLVRTIAVRVPVTYDPTTNRPARVTVHAEHISTDWRWGGNRNAELLDLIVVGASIWEQPS